MNPFCYRGYYYDVDLGMYYLGSRYYNQEWGRFINADGQLNGGLLGYNQFTYCGNNPVMNVDPDGHAWWHWALAATVIAACAVATVITCGGFAAAVTAVGLVASGSAAATASATIAASAFITSALALEAAACDAAINSSSVDEFMEQGSWWTVASVAGAAGFGGFAGYQMYKAQNPDPNPSTTSPCDGTNRGQHLSGVQSPKKMSVPDGSYTQYDSQGKIYSYTQYDSQGRQSMRIDFQGEVKPVILPIAS
ncbi:MAG: RHS repeat-associated core domain-containing protein [Eubacteriales bacterium]